MMPRQVGRPADDPGHNKPRSRDVSGRGPLTLLGMAFRYRLINAVDGRDIGPFVSKRDEWKAGDRIGRSKGEDMVVTAVIQPDDDVGFRAYLVVVPAETLRGE